MFSLNALSWFYARPQSIGPEKLRLRKLMVSASSCVGSISSVNPDSDDYVEKLSGRPSGFSGTSIVESVNLGSGKLRLDAWITSRISGISRARVQSSIRSGLVSVNSHVIRKVSHVVRDGDIVDCTISELQPLKAEPEDIPLDIVYEDDYMLVVNKPANMVVHPAPGNATGTLVNGILYHCRLSEVSFFDVEPPLSDDDEAFDFSIDQVSRRTAGFDLGEASVRPGIVHRLDKGTSGLLVVAKDELSHAHLAQQFKKHTIKRVYLSVTCGVPSPISGRINIPVGRDANNRIRMIAIPGSSTHGKARNAVSRYKVMEVLAGGGCALVEWRLETGRTHQIRAHAKYLGIPLLGDDVYGGSKNMALSLLQSKNIPSSHGKLMQLVSNIVRPCLHAFSLGFEHPHSGEHLHFTQMPPTDFAEILDQLRNVGTKKVACSVQS